MAMNGFENDMLNNQRVIRVIRECLSVPPSLKVILERENWPGGVRVNKPSLVKFLNPSLSCAYRVKKYVLFFVIYQGLAICSEP